MTLTDDNRRGLLGKGSVLLVTSHADRTAPTLRGKWILENLLGTPPPAPPGNVPPFEQTAGPRPRTIRERMEIHRANPSCAGRTGTTPGHSDHRETPAHVDRNAAHA